MKSPSVPIECFDGKIIECRTYQLSDLEAPEFKPSPHYKVTVPAPSNPMFFRRLSMREQWNTICHRNI